MFSPFLYPKVEMIMFSQIKYHIKNNQEGKEMNGRWNRLQTNCSKN